MTDSASPANMAQALAEFAAGIRRSADAAGSLSEEMLTAPCHDLLSAAAAILGAGEFTLVDKARVPGTGYPDMSVFNSRGQVIAYVELKAPGKGADPELFTGEHDRRQWERYRLLDNILYTDGLDWSLYRQGNRRGNAFRLADDLTKRLTPASVDGASAAQLLTETFSWTPAVVSGPVGLAQSLARYCRMLRDEIAAFGTEVPGLPPASRQALFPDLADDAFADAYAQAVTFAILAAASLEIRLDVHPDLHLRLYDISHELRRRRGVLGEALHLLTYSEPVQERLNIYLESLLALAESVDWDAIRSRGAGAGAGTEWLHFYEDFLAEYDRELRRQSGSYYTPAPVVEWMTRFADRLLVTRFGKQRGFADPTVTVVDPAAGTGTFLLSVVDRIAETVGAASGVGAVGAELSDAARQRLIAFEVQAGPYTVAQLRLAERLAAQGASAETNRVYFTDTLDDPFSDVPAAQSMFEQISASRTEANRVKREERVTVVLGNPPYLAQAAGRGGWVEKGDPSSEKGLPIFDDWRPPASWGFGPHVKHLSNLYVYFWRWAAWKAFEQPPSNGQPPAGLVTFIAPTAFLTGPGFARMRDWLRQQSTDIWVLHLTPEGHHAPQTHQVFGAMRQPVGIVTALRACDASERDGPAKVRFYRVQPAPLDDKLNEIAPLRDPDSPKWTTLPRPTTAEQMRASFDPPPSSAWNSAPRLDDIFPWHGNGVMIGRTWPVAPQPQTVRERWKALISETDALRQADLFKEHRRDRRIDNPVVDNLVDPPIRRPAIAGKETSEDASAPATVPYRWRSFDRQHLLADKRVINRPNPSLWTAHSPRQRYLCAPAMTTDGVRPLIASSAGLPIALCDALPDMDSLLGNRSGRVHPLWRDRNASLPNTAPGLLEVMSARIGAAVSGAEMFAYAAAVMAHPGYVARFEDDLRNADVLRLPITTDVSAFSDAVTLGQEVLKAHCFEVPATARRARLETPIPPRPAEFRYDADAETLFVASPGMPDGEISPVSRRVAGLTVGHTNVLESWFRPRTSGTSQRAASPLDQIRSDWTAADTSELLAMLAALERVTSLFDDQARLLERLMEGPMVGVEDLQGVGVLPVAADARRKPSPFAPLQASLLEESDAIAEG